MSLDWLQNKRTSFEDEFLARLAKGQLVSQDEYDQVIQGLPEEIVAAALAQRFEATNETKLLVESARLYLHRGLHYQALEVCSRAQRSAELQKIITRILPTIRRDYPDSAMVGKLTDEALLVIDLHSGQIIRFPPILPTTDLD